MEPRAAILRSDEERIGGGCKFIFQEQRVPVSQGNRYGKPLRLCRMRRLKQRGHTHAAPHKQHMPMLRQGIAIAKRA